MLFGVVTLLLVYRGASANQFDSDTRYECGAHGRFEYCIDGFPGCIIGCHCYPGYYFDTGSKICEPNTKLFKASRRFMEESIEITTQPPVITTILTTVSTTTELETKDLGDWLYNQFFKTIESQVVNNTGLEVKTRRSGSWPGLRSKRMKKTKRKKSKKKKKQDVRRKLLRISPDDSLFDRTDYSDSSGSSSSSGSGSSSSDTGSSSEEQPDQKDTKKLVIYNRRPKMQLPSFVFLPNMETPFFPPLGLSPPVMPMYPLVPVPPMFPPPLPPPPPPPPPLPTCQTAETAAPTMSTTKEPPTNKTLRHLRSRKRQGSDERSGPHRTNESFGRMGHEAHKNRRSDEDDEEMYDDALMNAVERPPGMDSVRFKYLTQLIHRDTSDVKKHVQNTDKPSSGMRVFNPPDASKPMTKTKRIIGNSIAGPHFAGPGRPVDTRRMYDNIDATAPTAPPADSFYSDLGRQIASLIRRADTLGDREIDIEVDDKPKAEAVFNMNSPSRSYWDRYVRSPVNSGNSREKLYDLENRVAIAAKDMPSLNLVQLENIALRDEAPPKEPEPQSLPASPEDSFNINLLPVFRRGYYETFYSAPSTAATPNRQAQKLQEIMKTLAARQNHVQKIPVTPEHTAEILFNPTKSQQFHATNSNSQQFIYNQQLQKQPMSNGQVNETISRLVPINIPRDPQNPYKPFQREEKTLEPIQRELLLKTLQHPTLGSEMPRNYGYYRNRIIQRYNSQKRVNNRVVHKHVFNDRDVKTNYVEKKYFEPVSFQQPFQGEFDL